MSFFIKGLVNKPEGGVLFKSTKPNYFHLNNNLLCRLLVVSTFAVFILPSGVMAQSVNEIDQATTQWLNIERQTNQLNVDWKEQSPILDQRISLLNAEKEQLKEVLLNSNEGGNDVDIKRAKLLTEQTQIEQQQAEMTKALQLLHYTNNTISVLLPPVLKDHWQNEDVAEADNNTKNLQSALAKLTQLAEFNNSISTHESTIAITQGEGVQSQSIQRKPMLVQQLFLGASTAWFVTRDGQYAGRGSAGNEGWEWRVDDKINGNDIKQAIAIFQKKQSADWVTLPIHLTDVSVIEKNIISPSSNNALSNSTNDFTPKEMLTVQGEL